MTALLRLIRYAAPYRGRLLLALVAMIVYAVGSAGVVGLIQVIYDRLLLPGTSAGAPAQWPNYIQAAYDYLLSVFQTDIRAVALLILTAYLLKGLGSYASGFLMTDVGQRVVMDLRNHLYRHILSQSASFFASRSSGQLISRITNDVNQVQTAVSETLADLLRESLAVVGYIGWLFYLDWRLALVCMTTAPLVAYPLAQLGRKVRSTTRLGQAELARVTHLATQGFTSHRIVKAFGAEDREASRFARAAFGLYRTNMKVTSALSSLPPLMEFVGGIASVGALWYGSRRIEMGLLTPGQFTQFLAAAFMMYGPIKKLSRVNANIQQTIAAAERIFDVLDLHTEVHDRPGAKPLPRLQASVEFRGVGFAYEDRPDRFVLRHASLTVRAGQVVALVGLSGAGKTTLVNLIPRFFDPTEGSILVDGVDIRDVSLASLRAQIALVTQETVLFDDSIAANIAYGAPGSSREAIEAAARAAHAHEFIVHLDGGYDAEIGERGQRLSGGQRQRLAIARAILRDSPLLILDEATSSLDVESEALVQDALVNLMRNRTTFVIAHRLSTVRRADMIVALEHGRIVEIGTHETLVDRDGGVYAKLYALQAFDDRDRPHGRESIVQEVSS